MPLVPELVQQDRQEEQQRRDDRERERLDLVAGEQIREVARQQPDDQEQHEEPAHVDADSDPEHACKPDGTAPEHLTPDGGRGAPGRPLRPLAR
jgi:hypothetical protein